MSFVLAKGTVVAKRYEIVDVIGEGGMGTVYRAKELAFDRIVALKVLKAKLASTTSGLKRFIAEAQVTAKLAHDNIVSVYTIDVWQERPYIVMEYVEGDSFEGLFESGLDLSIGLQILEKTAQGLSAAHAAGLIHRDLKPENILVGGITQSQIGLIVKVVDWGIAKEVVAPKHLTKTGLVLGTPFYMAPEQILGRELSPATDFYAFGVMLFRLLTGQFPFKTRVITEVIDFHLNTEPPSVRSLVPGVPKELANLTHRLLAKKAADRPKSVKEIVAVIRRNYGSRADHATHKRSEKTKVARSPRTLAPKVLTSKLVAKKPPQGKRPPLLFLASVSIMVVILIAGLSQWGTTSSGAVSGMTISDVKLTDVAKIRIRLKGEVGKGISLVAQEFTLPLPEKGYETLTRTRKAIELDLPRAVFNKTEVKIAGDKSFLLNPFLLPQIQLLRKYRDERLRVLLDQVNKERDLLSTLSRAGFDARFSQWLDNNIDKMLLLGSSLSSAAARTLLPVVLLERDCQSRTNDALPWKPIRHRLQILQEHMPKVKNYPRDVPGTLLGRINCQTYLINENGQRKLRCLWVHSPEQVTLAKANPQKYINFSNNLSFSPGLARARLSDWQSVRKKILEISMPENLTWPPQKLRLILDTRFFTHDRIVEISFNNGPVYSVYRDLGIQEGSIHFWTEDTMRISIPLNPGDLRLGQNNVTMRARLISNKVPLNGSRFEGFAVVIP